MKSSHKITIDIPEEVFTGIANFKKRAHISDDKTAIFELLKYALTLPPYFHSFDWQKAEAEADSEITANNVKSFSSVDEFLADLKA